MVCPGLEPRSGREHKLARLGRVVGEAHAAEVGGGRAVVKQLDLVPRIAAWPGEQFVDEQPRQVGVDCPRPRACRLANRLPRARAVFADDLDDRFAGRKLGQANRLIDGVLAAKRAVVDAVAVMRDAGAADGEHGARLTGRRARFAGDRRAARHARAHVEPVRPGADRGRAGLQPNVERRIDEHRISGKIALAEPVVCFADDRVEHVQPHPVLLEPKRLELNQFRLVAGENVAGEQGAARHLELAQRLVERDRAERAAVKCVVHSFKPTTLLQQYVVVVVVKNVSHHRNVRCLSIVSSRGECGGNARAAVAFVKAVKRVSLYVRVHPVEVHPVVAAANKLIVVHLQNWPGPLAAADIQNVVVAARRAEAVPLKKQLAAGADADAAHVFAVAEIREHAVAHRERGVLKPDQIRPRVVPLHMVERDHRVRDRQCVRAGVMKIDVRQPVAGRRAAEADAAPRTVRVRRAEKLDAPQRIALGEQSSLDEQPSLRPETNRRAGIDHQRDTGRHDQRLGHEQRSGRRPAGRAGQPLAKRAGRRVAVPDIGELAGDLAAAAVQRAHEQPVQPGTQRHLGLPPRLRRKPVGSLAIDLDRDRQGGGRLAGQRHRRAVRKKETGALGQAGGHSQFPRDSRKHKLAAAGRERLEPVDLRQRQIIADEPVDHRVKLIGRKHRLGQVFQVKPVPGRHLRAAHQLAQHRIGGGAPQRAFRPALCAKHSVEVVWDQHKPPIHRPGVQRVVALVAGREAGLHVAEQIVHGEVPHPRVDVHPVVRLAKRAEKTDQVGVVVLPRV